MAKRKADERLPHMFGASCSSGCAGLRPYTISSTTLQKRWHTTATEIQMSVNLSMGMRHTERQCSDVMMLL